MHSAKPDGSIGADNARQSSLGGSGRWRLSLGRDTLARGQAFIPSSEDIRLALRHLEVPGTGKVRESQVKMLLELTFGEASLEKLTKLRETCNVVDGRMAIGDVESAIDKDFLCHKDTQQEEGSEEASPSSISPSIGSRLPKRSSSRALVKSKRQSASTLDCLAEYAEAFVRFDYNKDGKIDARDLKHSVESSTLVKLSLDDCKGAIARVDTQETGGVTLLNFRLLLEHLDELLAGAEDDQL